MNNAQPKIDFKAKQAEFSAYIRNPNSQPCPSDVAPQRMQMYRELFFNNVEGFLSSNFPVLHKILNQEQWRQLAQDFFSQHQSTTPYFSEIPEEFILYLQNERQIQADDYPFMLELAHYEWVEMALSIAQDTLPEKSNPQTLTQLQKISLSPLTWLLAYQYPVHKISPNYLPIEAPEQGTYLAVYRDKLDEVKFIELAPMSFRLLQTLQEQQTKRISDCLKEVLPKDSSEALQNAAIGALQQFLDKQLIYAE
ncbi:MAG: putative DNA-binding domain-containing protein [Methyloprofundus sp.]|nr:putative DNA-binding domain-containing protein [Methyloprofundus sp.]MDT8426336.1 putative DNA-binding domain-containing protein [Methyloprofundus sp.]